MIAQKDVITVIIIKGKHNRAVCYCDALEDAAREQIQELCDLEIFAGSGIRIMPDVHAGAGCTIGTTMTVTDKVAPSLVGVDIGCGMETVKLEEKVIDFAKLDHVIRSLVPAGENIREMPHPFASQIELKALRCLPAINPERAALSIGTLGGGNHFIEIDRDEEGFLYLIVHSGSRYLGVQVAGYYRKLGWKTMNSLSNEVRRELIDRYKAEGRPREIEMGLHGLQDSFAAPMDISESFAYVEGQNLENYIHDMRIVQYFATLNRQAITQTILEGMGLAEIDRFTTIHNYIDTENRILRKGAVSAQKGERLLIPINMRDGALICIGKGNPDWNYSAPHGAGRILSRTEAQNTLSIEEFQREMEGIYTTCVAHSTLDESPMAYKGRNAIVSQIEPTAEIVKQIRPIYNFKAGI